MEVGSQALATVPVHTPENCSDLSTPISNNALALPENWPNIPKLQEKLSWDYSTAISPSVNKATSHLELLQNIIEEWFKDNKSLTLSAQSKHFRVTEPKAAKKAMTFDATQRLSASDGSSTFSADLSIHGVGGLDTRERKTTIVAPETRADSEEKAPYLGAEEVIEEVVVLLAKLESDRKDTLASLKSERDKVATLQLKIDSLSSKRLFDLPFAVQKEHEDCAMDISELNWHVSYRGRILERRNNKVAVADALNRRLKEEIAFVNQHIPLVEEKLDLEVDAMDRIQQAQIDTNEELDLTLKRCVKVEGKSQEAQKKADEERASIKQDLDNVRNELQRISEDLAEAKMLFNSYTHKCNDCRQQLQDNEQDLAVQLVKDENIRAAEEMQAAKVRELETRLRRADFDRKKFSEENSKLQHHLDENTAKFTKREDEMRAKLQEKEESLRLLTLENDELDMDVEDSEKKVLDCDRQKEADEKNLERMSRELDRTEEQINFTMDDLGNVTIINNAVRDQLQKEEERCMEAEEALRTTTEALKKQVKEEIHSRTVLIARIHSDNSDLTRAQEESQTKKDMITKKFNEVDKAVNIVVSKVEKLRLFHKEKTKMIGEINEELQKIANTKKAIGDKCDTQRQTLVPTHTKNKETLTKVEKKLDHIEFKTDMMNKKIKEMDESSAMMVKSLSRTNSTIKQLELDLEELTIQIETGEAMEADLQKSHKTVLGRFEENDQLHQEHMASRHKVLEEHEKSLEYNVVLNREIAARYRNLQNHYVALRNEMLNQYDSRVKLENAVKDLKQLKGLQVRMHTALMQYLKLRGLYNKGELKRMEEESHCNGVKVTDLQGQMDVALDMISSFLTHQLDGDTIRKMAMEKVEREEQLVNNGLTVPPIKTGVGVS